MRNDFDIISISTSSKFGFNSRSPAQRSHKEMRCHCYEMNQPWSIQNLGRCDSAQSAAFRHARCKANSAVFARRKEVKCIQCQCSCFDTECRRCCKLRSVEPHGIIVVVVIDGCEIVLRRRQRRLLHGPLDLEGRGCCPSMRHCRVKEPRAPSGLLRNRPPVGMCIGSGVLSVK